MTKPLNEATLTARLHKILETVFPTFKSLKITHQGSFSIKFGHHHVKVDLKDPKKYPNRAIFDMLLSHEDHNIMLVELKRENHPINQEDIDQGLSYARLIPKMPPIVLITNGDDNRLYNSYTMKPCDTTCIDLAYIQSQIDKSFSLATAAFQDATNHLLNRQPELIGRIISKLSMATFGRQSGEVHQLDKAICKDFQIKRKIVRRIYCKLLKEDNVIGVVGQAFSGKTNVLYQFFRSYGFQKEHAILYIDLKDSNFSIFQLLAQEFSRETKDHISIERIRVWLMSMLNYDPGFRFILLADNLHSDISESISNELLELINLFKDTKHRIIYTIDEWTYSQIAFKKKRHYKNLIGTVTKIFTITDLNAREFRSVNKWLFKTCKTIIPFGGHYCEEYRKLRILRLMSSSAAKTQIDSDGYARFQTIPDLELIHRIGKNPIFTQEVHDFYKEFVVAFVRDKATRNKNPSLGIIAKTLGAVSEYILKKLTKEEYEGIITSDLVVKRQYGDGLHVIIPKVPELLIFHYIDFAYSLIKSKISHHNEEQIYRYLLDLAGELPESDIIGNGILQKIGKFDVDLFTTLIESLIDDEPIREKIMKGTEILIFSKQHGHIRVKFDSDTNEESLISTHLPSSILAQMVGTPMQNVTNNGAVSYDFFIDLLLTLGAETDFIHRIGQGTFDDIKPVLMWEIEGVGTILSEKNGVIETLVQSYQKCFLHDPTILEKLFEKAKQKMVYSAIWRIYQAVKPLHPLKDATLELKARMIEVKSRSIIFGQLNEITGFNVKTD